MRLLAVVFCCALAAPVFSEVSKAPTKALGSAVAPIQLEVFSDFQCPACKNLHETTLKQLIDEYVNSKKKVYLIHREFPLPMHTFARTAASYACAAERLGKYEQVGDALFRNQETWAMDGNIEKCHPGVLSAAELQMVRALTKDPGVVSEVEKDVQLGQSKQVRSTPTMILTYKNQQYPIANVSYSLLKRFIDDLLSK
jgi:protein-disulfide isomerase